MNLKNEYLLDYNRRQYKLSNVSGADKSQFYSTGEVKLNSDEAHVHRASGPKLICYDCLLSLNGVSDNLFIS